MHRSIMEEQQMTESDYSQKDHGSVLIKQNPSNWTCYAFGGDSGFSPITWTPQEGKVPNAWVRFWSKVFFDCNWVKK